jgi:hypothetical protein
MHLQASRVQGSSSMNGRSDFAIAFRATTARVDVLQAANITMSTVAPTIHQVRPRLIGSGLGTEVDP